MHAHGHWVATHGMTRINTNRMTICIQDINLWGRIAIEHQRRGRRRQRPTPSNRCPVVAIATASHAMLKIHSVTTHQLKRASRVAPTTPRWQCDRFGAIDIGNTANRTLRLLITIALTTPQRSLPTGIHHHVLRGDAQGNHTTGWCVVLNPRVELPACTFHNRTHTKAIGAIPHALTALAVFGFHQHVQTHYCQPMSSEMLHQPDSDVVDRCQHRIARLDGRIESSCAHTIRRWCGGQWWMAILTVGQT